MATLLQIDSSGKGDDSVTKKLNAYFVEKWKASNPDGKVIRRDLTKTQLGFATSELIGAFYSPAEALNQEQKNLLELPNTLMSEIQEADVYVIGAPMYNFSVPAVLKAYIDTIVRPGLTFSYTSGIPKGLLTNKKLFVITASGGDYSKEPMKNMDFVEPYLRAVFGFLGVTDVTFIKSHGNDPDTIAATSKIAEATIDGYFQPILV